MKIFNKKKSALDILKRKINAYCSELPYIINKTRYKNMNDFLNEARTEMEKNNISKGYNYFYQAKREYNIARKNKEIFYRRNWIGMLISLFLVIIFISGVLVVFNFKKIFNLDPLILLSILGGGIGGCCAVLIQVIDVDPESEVVSKLPWYLIKPILGAVLGLIIYVALTSGLDIISDDLKFESFEAALIIGFLSGFFESFSRGILGRIANKLIEDKEK